MKNWKFLSNFSEISFLRFGNFSKIKFGINLDFSTIKRNNFGEMAIEIDQIKQPLDVYNIQIDRYDLLLICGMVCAWHFVIMVMYKCIPEPKKITQMKDQDKSYTQTRAIYYSAYKSLLFSA